MSPDAHRRAAGADLVIGLTVLAQTRTWVASTEGMRAHESINAIVSELSNRHGRRCRANNVLRERTGSTQPAGPRVTALLSWGHSWSRYIWKIPLAIRAEAMLEC